MYKSRYALDDNNTKWGDHFSPIYTKKRNEIFCKKKYCELDRPKKASSHNTSVSPRKGVHYVP